MDLKHSNIVIKEGVIDDRSIIVSLSLDLFADGFMKLPENKKEQWRNFIQSHRGCSEFGSMNEDDLPDEIMGKRKKVFDSFDFYCKKHPLWGKGLGKSGDAALQLGNLNLHKEQEENISQSIILR